MNMVVVMLVVVVGVVVIVHFFEKDKEFYDKFGLFGLIILLNQYSQFRFNAKKKINSIIKR